MIVFNGLSQVRSLLCLGAHSDDIEIGAGATILRLLRESPGTHVHWCVFSGNEARQEEARRSAELFLADAESVTIEIFAHTDGFFPAEFVEIKKRFEAIKKQIEPDLVLTHRRDDRHQDHRTLSDLAWNTFRSHPIWEYEIAKWDGDLGQPNAYVQIDPDLAAKKCALLMQAFATQRSKHWFDEETFRSLLRLRGLESNARYAEAFTVRKVVY